VFIIKHCKKTKLPSKAFILSQANTGHKKLIASMGNLQRRQTALEERERWFDGQRYYLSFQVLGWG